MSGLETNYKNRIHNKAFETVSGNLVAPVDEMEKVMDEVDNRVCEIEAKLQQINGIKEIDIVKGLVKKLSKDLW